MIFPVRHQQSTGSNLVFWLQEYVAEVNDSGDLPFYIDAERGMLVEVLDYHRGVAPWQDMWQHRTRGPLFLTTAWTSNQFALPQSKTLLVHLLNSLSPPPPSPTLLTTIAIFDWI